MSLSNLSSKLSLGVIWNFLELIISKGGSALLTIFLATVLSPENFGLIAILVVFFEVAQALTNSGLQQAIIRKKSLTPLHVSSYFVFSVVSGTILYLLLFLYADYLEVFFGVESFAFFLRVSGVVCIINALKAVQTALLTRDMNFYPMMVANVIGILSSSVIAVWLAYAGYGIWSLVSQMLVSAAVSAALLWRKSHWRPSVRFEKKAFLELFDFGKYLLVANVLNILFKNSYVLVIGKFFSPEATGVYFFSKKISQIVAEQLSTAFQRASYPFLSRYQDQESLVKEKSRLIVKVVYVVISPIMIFMAAVADVFFPWALSEKWQSGAPIFQILCLVGLLIPLNAMNINIVNASGRSDWVLKSNLIKKCIVIFLLVMAVNFSVMAIVYAQLGASFLSLFPNAYYTKKVASYGIFEQLSDVFPPFIGAVMSGLLILVMTHTLALSPLLLIMLSLLAGAVFYLMFLFCFRLQGAVLILKSIGPRLWKGYQGKN